MARRTPQYKLIFYEFGDIFRGPDDEQNTIIVDNQLIDISRIVGNGVLSGWNLSCVGSAPPSVRVSPGEGFIRNIITRTLSFKDAALPSDATVKIYLQTSAFDPTIEEGLQIGVESPAVPLPFDSLTGTWGGVTYENVGPPAVPAGFKGLAVFHDVIHLFWDANTELDFDHYELQRSTDDFVSVIVDLDDTDTPGIQPDLPYVDTGLKGSTPYYYRIRAVDTAGNASAYVDATQIDGTTAQPIVTLVDTTQPGEASDLRLFGGDGHVAVVFEESLTPDVVGYIVKAQEVDLVGVPFGATTSLPESLSTTRVITGLSDSKRYRVTVQSKNEAGNLSDGVISDITVSPIGAPDEISALTATSASGGIDLAWTASPDADKDSYLVTVFRGVERDGSVPVSSGLVTSKSVTGFSFPTDVGVGSLNKLEVDQSYLVRVQTADSLGKTSPGVFVKGTIIDDVPPRNPNSLIATAGDGLVSTIWQRSPSLDVVSYLFAFSVDGGAFTEFSVGDTNAHVLTGLTNGLGVVIRVKAVDDAGLASSGILSETVTPVADTIAPPPPENVTAEAGDSQVKLRWDSSPAEDFDHFEVLRQIVVANPSTSPDAELPIDVSGSDPSHPVPVQLFDVGDELEFLDLALVNGQFYAYTVRAVDDKGNIGDFSTTQLLQPSSNINVDSSSGRRLIEPRDVVAVYDSGTESIKLTWTYFFPTGADDTGNETTFSGGEATYPSDGPTDFNIYRSDTGPLTGFSLLTSIKSNKWEFFDTIDLVDDREYFYAVSAVRDNADVIVETSSVAPPNSIILGTIRVSGGVCESVTSEKRVVDQLDAAIRDEVDKRILRHKHTASPINSALVEANRNVAMSDVLDIRSTCFSVTSISDDTFSCGDNLSPEAIEAYIALIVERVNIEEKTATLTRGRTEFFGHPNDPNDLGVIHTYYVRDFVFRDLGFFANQAYAVDPTSATWSIPFVGDFQVLVDNQIPEVPFGIDRTRNIVIFEEPLPEGSVVTLDGLGFSYYVPLKIDNDQRGLRILVDGVEDRVAAVDERKQTVRFSPAVDLASTITLEIEPVIPDFGTQSAPRQINLAPDIVLDDLDNLDGRVFQSRTGVLTEGDTIFPVDTDGNRITGFTIDFDNQQIVLDNPVGTEDTLGLEIRNKPEVQGLLPPKRIPGVDGSVFTSGTFTKPQLPPISHDGRVKELAKPVSSRFVSGNNYVYTGAAGVIGNATTPYAVELVGNRILVGSSNGFNRSSFGNLLLSTEDQAFIDPNQAAALLVFDDDVVTAAEKAVENGGRIAAQIRLPSVGAVTNASLVTLDDGTILVAGGSAGASVFIYDPVALTTLVVASMSTPREGHSAVKLRDGRVLVAGGRSDDRTCMDTDDFDALPSLPPRGIVGLNQLSSVEVYSPSGDTWSSLAALPEPRSEMGVVVLDTNRVLIAGGQTLENSDGDGDIGYTKQDDVTCDRLVDVVEYDSARIYSISGDSWATTGDLVGGADGLVTGSGIFDGTPFVVLDSTKQIFDIPDETWAAGEVVEPETTTTEGVRIEEPIKQFFVDSQSRVLAVGRNRVYLSNNDGETWTETDGLDAIGVVHRIDEAGGVMYAGTDLGVYVMTSASISWSQGGLIGAGTTETFDLLPHSMFYPTGEGILAATEIGVFFSVDVAQTWLRITPEGLENIRNIERLGTENLFVTADQAVWKSTDRGMTWSFVSRQTIIDPATRMVSRNPSELFLGTGQGLYRSIDDGLTFSLVQFDTNRSTRENAVQYVGLLGDDLVVTYDLAIFALDPELTAIKVAEFLGTIPTVRVNDVDQRNGYRYDINSGEVVFEFKRFSNDIVSVTSNYSVYFMTGGPWHAQNPNAPVRVFVNDEEASGFTTDPFTGAISFADSLRKQDVVTASIANTFLNNAGSLFHSELEDRFELEKGLPLSLGRDLACNILQIGLAFEHNFFVREIERNQYYCFSEGFVDRSINALMENTEFFIMGRRDFDNFNSTIDYQKESEQPDSGFVSVLCLSTLLVLDDLILIGTEDGLFIMDGVPGGITAPVLLAVETPDDFEGPVRDLSVVFGDIYAAAKSGVHKITVANREVASIEKNAGNGLSGAVFTISGLNDVLVAGTAAGMFYADDPDNDFDEWFRGDHVDVQQRTDLPLLGPASALAIKDGLAFSGIGNEVYRSTDGRLWKRVFQIFDGNDQVLDPGAISSSDRAGAAATTINEIAIFEDKVYLATRRGLFNDNGSAKSDEVKFDLEPINGATGDNDIPINDVIEFIGNSSSELFAVGEAPYLYNFKATLGGATPLTPSVIQGGEGTEWTKEQVDTDTSSLDKVIPLLSGTRIVFAGNFIFFG